MVRCRQSGIGGLVLLRREEVFWPTTPPRCVSIRMGAIAFADNRLVRELRRKENWFGSATAAAVEELVS
jgi:hypothetical protein